MAIARQVLCLCAFLSLPHARCEPLRYSVAEEGESGSVVGNVAEDAGLAPAQLSARGARLASEDGRQPFRLERGTGRLVVAERLDREQLCGQAATCTLAFELLLANPLQFFRVEVALQDVNDHSPVFPEERVTLRIPERSDPGSRFPLEGARDLDVGSNSIQAYSIAPENEHFRVSFGSQSEDDKYVELVLEKPLDREEQAELDFSLIAVDGGSPPRSGTTEIHVVVLDVNDNAPIFTQELYVGQVLENAPEGSVVLRVVASDRDVGVNGDISYQFSQGVGQSYSAFAIDPMSGEIKLTKPLDFEEAEKHKLGVQAVDGGGLSAMCKVVVEVVDVNDNAPELVVSSFSSPLPENALPGTVVALFTVRDRDAGANGKVSCALEDQLSFSLRPAYKNYYELVTMSTLDREETAQYTVTITAADAGSPPLTMTQTFTVDISDINDNVPVFNQTSYTMYVRENNVPTMLVGAVTASDADEGPNAKVTYSLALAHPAERPPCSCISVNSENGHVFVLRPLDYEQVRQIEVLVLASDMGSPPLSSNVTVRLVVVDENDNAPLVLYPSQESSPPSSELVPLSAEAGYLITKVVAVDADSGQNSWLSYHLLKATDPGLFVVGSQSGELRLRRPVTERDAVKQKLVVLVRDNGQPPQSATVALSALLLNDFSDVRLPQNSLVVEDEGGSLTTYLIVSLVFISLLFLASMVAFTTFQVCKRKELKREHMLYGTSHLQSSLADAATAGTLPHGYCYEVSLTTGSGKSEFKFLKPILPSLPPQHCTPGEAINDEREFPRGPITAEDMAPENPGRLSSEQFNSLSFNYKFGLTNCMLTDMPIALLPHPEKHGSSPSAEGNCEVFECQEVGNCSDGNDTRFSPGSRRLPVTNFLLRGIGRERGVIISPIRVSGTSPSITMRFVWGHHEFPSFCSVFKDRVNSAAFLPSISSCGEVGSGDWSICQRSFSSVAAAIASAFLYGLKPSLERSNFTLAFGQACRQTVLKPLRSKVAVAARRLSALLPSPALCVKRGPQACAHGAGDRGQPAAQATGGCGRSPAASRRVAIQAKAERSGCGRGGVRAPPSPAQPSRAAAASGSPGHPLPRHGGRVPSNEPDSVRQAKRGRGPACRAAAGRHLPRRTARAIRETEAGHRPAMAIARQVLCLCAFLSLPHARCEPLRYFVAEEGESGSVVGNVAEDAGLALAQLSARGARLASEDGRQPFRLERGRGRLVVAERLDREQLCGQAATCTLAFELLLANPLQFFRVEVALQDVNDHSPVFPEERVTLSIPETSNVGSRFPLEGAQDLDAGSNSIQAYSIAPENEHFSVSFGSRVKGKKYVELVLEKPLDREEQAELDFSLIAVDGGSPPRSGTTQIHIVVLDVNDNAPIFTQELYVGRVLENAPEGSVVLRVVASDRDMGVNGDISYQFSQGVGQSYSAFEIESTSGEIKLSKPLDFEEAENHELSVRARDGGGLSAMCKVVVEVVDVNDNAPELVVSSFSSPIPENTLPGTVVALFTVRDRDAGANGKVSCALEDQLSFSLRPAYKNYYELVTVSTLDREETAQYIVTVTAADAGSPPLTMTQTFTVDISDVNDNVPVFNQTSYTMYVRENNVPTVLVGAVTASDADEGPNAKVTYSLAQAHPAERPPCSCISVNSENGHVFVLRPLDYEQVRQIEVLVLASDMGSPPLSSNITVRLVVVDENDNAPLVLYPSQESSPPSSELVPLSAEAGYLITKVVAVDADSGQNSWLSYHLLKATDPGLFVVGSQSGELRLRRPVTERDAVKQKLVVLVRDNGQPPQSATVALSALLLNDFSDVRLPQNSLVMEDEGGSLTTYLIVSLVFISLLFLASMVAFTTFQVCKRKELKSKHMLYGTSHLQSSLADAATAGTLPHGYCYEVSLTTGSGKSEFKFLKPILPSLPPQHCAPGEGIDDERDFRCSPITAENMAADNPGRLSSEQFNSLSFN
ncbi:uncharacterized protein VSU04_010172 [Chlamydotis macqueenii]